MVENIFREARQLLNKKDAGAELTDQDWEVWGAAMAVLNNPACPLPHDMTVAECLEELSAMIEGGGNDK